MPWSYAAAPPWVVRPRRPVVTIESTTGFSTSGFCPYAMASCRGSPLGGAAAAPGGEH
ncbi:hypothetical protein N9L68_07640 [bacterium]|nr:hypothetical protein [bacterium]